MQLGGSAPSQRASTGRRPKECAMKIGLWAEIRRLAEIEKLSRRAMAGPDCDARDTS